MSQPRPELSQNREYILLRQSFTLGENLIVTYLYLCTILTKYFINDKSKKKIVSGP